MVIAKKLQVYTEKKSNEGKDSQCESSSQLYNMTSYWYANTASNLLPFSVRVEGCYYLEAIPS